MLKISPSLLACDFTRMGREMRDIREAGADMLHVDVMDGQFVPNISMGQPVLASLKKACPDIYYDVHLMILDPLRYVEDFVRAGADMVVFHVESRSDPRETIAAIRSCDVHAGMAMKPGTAAHEVFPYLSELDMVLVMTVEPGFGGQAFMPQTMPKVTKLRERCSALGLHTDIQVDGGIGLETGPVAVKSGANVLVAGSAIFNAPDYAAAIAELRRVCD